MKRVIYQGHLRLPFGFHTCNGRQLDVSDQPLLRDVNGRVELAATSLAGVLRSDLHRLVLECEPEACQCRATPDCRCVVCHLMGPEARQPKQPDDISSSLAASRLHVRVLRLDEDSTTRIRNRVGISRRTKTAADKRKYDIEVAADAVEFPFELRIDDALDCELEYLEALLLRLTDGWLVVGGKSSSGPGRTSLRSLSRHVLDLDRVGDLVDYLLDDDSTAGCTSTHLLPFSTGTESEGWGLTLKAAPNGDGEVSHGQGWAQLRLALEFTFPWGFLVNDPAEAILNGFDHSFARLPDGRPLLPGSTLRGALRSRAEQILRTLGGNQAACYVNSEGCACHERIDVEDEDKGRNKSLTFEEEWSLHCLACRVFGSGRLVSSVKLTDFHSLAGHCGEPIDCEFVAIDRFTGGAADTAKFDARAQAGVTFGGELYFEVGPHRLQDWGLGLLFLVLRDLILGDIPLGFGTAKGLNEYTALPTMLDRFWIQPPTVLAGIDLPQACSSGTVRWRANPPPETPQQVGEVLGEVLCQRVGEWVAALHQTTQQRGTTR